jgi:hypothetical protein
METTLAHLLPIMEFICATALPPDVRRWLCLAVALLFHLGSAPGAGLPSVIFLQGSA